MTLDSEIETKTESALRRKLVRIESDPSEAHIVSVAWDLSSVCNYSCTYCDSNYHDAKHSFPDMGTVRKFFESLSRHFANRQLVFEIKGGEPTLWKDLPTFLEEIQSRGWKSSLVSNGSRSEDWWRKHHRLMHQVILSFHPERASIDHFDKLVEMMAPTVDLSVMVLMYPEKFEIAKSAVLRLKNKLSRYNLIPVVVSQPYTENKIYEYTPEQHKDFEMLGGLDYAPPNMHFEPIGRFRSVAIFADGGSEPVNPEQLKLQGHNWWAGWKCTAGLYRLQIEMNGDVYRGQCRVGGPIGNINDQVVFPTEEVTCTKARCFCGNEVRLPKRQQEVMTT